MGFMDFLGSNAMTNSLLGVGALASVGTNIFNYGLQREAFDYQKSLNDTIMAREDTAIQRRMADAAAAGLNPYAVVGQGAGSGGNVSAPKAAQLPNGTMDALLSAIQAKQGILQTKGQEIANKNAEKQGMILDADLAGKLESNEIIGYNKQMANIDLQDREIDHFYKNMQKLADFNALPSNEMYSNWYKKYISGVYSPLLDLTAKKISNDYNKAKFDWNTFETDYKIRAEDYAGLKLKRAMDDKYYANQRISEYNTQKSKEEMMQKQLNWYNIEEGSSLLSSVFQLLRMLLK